MRISSDSVRSLPSDAPDVMAQVQMSILKKVMNVEKNFAESLLSSMGIGKNLNITA